MKLAGLDPRLMGTLASGVLFFDCPFPACQARGPHRVAVAVSAAPYHERPPQSDDHPGVIQKGNVVKVWQASGEFPDSVTLTPSVDLVDEQDVTTCWHGHITNGEAT